MKRSGKIISYRSKSNQKGEYIMGKINAAEENFIKPDMKMD